MQLFLISWTTMTLIHFGLFTYICIYETKAEGRIFIDRKGRIHEGYPWSMMIVFGLFLAIYHIFMTLLFVSYYHYIRDRQLELEQQQGRMHSVQAYK
ncbi:unnamed protein product, partial [Mesorhabditis spiculigera]